METVLGDKMDERGARGGIGSGVIMMLICGELGTEVTSSL